MDKQKMPVAETSARPGIRAEISPKALQRWNPDVMAAGDTQPDNSISILDVIGEDWWTGEGVTAKRIAAALRSIGNQDVIVNINSPGGDFFEGLAIYNMLREHPAKVTVKVLGLAASAASVIAMAGDEIQVARAGFLMIHNTWVVAAGDRNALRDVAEWLTPFDAAAVDIYAARSGVDADDIAAMLDKETWISGKEAVEKGFADSLLATDEVKNSVRQEGNQAVAFHTIDSLLAKVGIPRSKRRELIQAAKRDTQDAVTASKQDAAVLQEIQNLITTAQSITEKKYV